jgi:hypothetical protein
MIRIDTHHVVDSNGNHVGVEFIDIEKRRDNMILSPIDNTTPMHKQDFLTWLQNNPAEIAARGWKDPANHPMGAIKWDALANSCNDPNAHPEAKALGLKTYGELVKPQPIGVTANEQSDTAPTIDTQSAE